MLPSIESLRKELHNAWWMMGAFTAIMSIVFFLALVPVMNISIKTALAILGGFICAGLVFGIYIIFRSHFGTSSVLVGMSYLIIVLELMFTGGGVMMLAVIAGHLNAAWMGLGTNVLAMVLSMLGGMFNEAKALDVWNNENPGIWKEYFDRHIDYQKAQVSPNFTIDNKQKAGPQKSHSWLVAIGTTNIPLLFEIYGGGRANAIFLAAPFLILTFAYLNLRTFGPTLTRLLLLRKIEKEVGHRFQNADYEKIQELRRGFVLARWLMKDYRPPQIQAAAGASEIQKDNSAKKKKRKRGE